MTPLSGSESHAPRIVKVSRLVGPQVGGLDDRADADGVGLGVGKIRAARARQLRFQFLFAAHEDFLHFLGGLVFVVFAQIAITARDGDFLRVGRNFFLHEFLIFERGGVRDFPTKPASALSCRVCSPLTSDCTAGCALTSRASSERLSMSSNTGENCSARVRSLTTSMSADAVNSPINSWSSKMKSRRRLERFSLNWSRSIAVSMARKHFRAENVGKSVVALAAEPEQQFAAGRVLVDEPGERFLEQIHLAFAESAGWRTPWHSLAETKLSEPRKISCQRSGFAVLNDSSAR